MNWSCPVQLHEVVQLLLLEASNFGTTKKPINYNVNLKIPKNKTSDMICWRTSAMLHRSSTRNLISWDGNSSFSCLSCCCACVLQHCNDNFYLQENHSKSKVKTARLPLEKMHVLQPALFLHPGSQRRFRREIAELPNCNLDHLFKVSSQEKESHKMTEGRHQCLLIAIEVWWSRLWACCQHIFLANLFRFWKLPPAPALL